MRSRKTYRAVGDGQRQRSAAASKPRLPHCKVRPASTDVRGTTPQSVDSATHEGLAARANAADRVGKPVRALPSIPRTATNCGRPSTRPWPQPVRTGAIGHGCMVSIVASVANDTHRSATCPAPTRNSDRRLCAATASNRKLGECHWPEARPLAPPPTPPWWSRGSYRPLGGNAAELCGQGVSEASDHRVL